MWILHLLVLAVLANQSDKVYGRQVQNECRLSSSVVLSCSDGTSVNILDAFYGRMRPDPSYCPPLTNHSTGECEDRHAKLRVQDFCQGKSVCDIPVSSSTFGDPCSPETQTYLAVSYECVERNVRKVVRTCEGDVDSAEVRCPSNTLISIDGAFFGRLLTSQGVLGVCASGVNNDDVHCYNEDTTIRIREECEDRESCSILPNNGFFGIDPCPGTSKYVFIIYSCTTPVCGGYQFFDPSTQTCCHEVVFDKDSSQDRCCPGDFDHVFDDSPLKTPTRGCCPPNHTPYNSQSFRCCRSGVRERVENPTAPDDWQDDRCLN